jgi:integrase
MISTIGDTPLCDLAVVGGAANAFEKHISSLNERSCAPRTMALHRSAFVALLKHLHYTSVIPHLPAIRPIKVRRVDQLPIVPLSAYEVERLLEHSTTPMHRALFALTVGVGLRPSEALNTRWEDLDFEKGELKVRGTKTSSSAATIPLTALAHREMKEFQRRLQTKQAVGFSTPSQAMSFTGSAFQAGLKAAASDVTQELAFEVNTSPVQCKKVTDNEWVVFENVKAAAKALKLRLSSIKRCLAGTTRETKGFSFRFVGGSASFEIEEGPPVEAMSVKSKVWMTYPSARGASKALGIPLPRVTACLNRESKSAKGHLFRFLHDTDGGDAGTSGRDCVRPMQIAFGPNAPSGAMSVLDLNLARSGPCFINSRTRSPILSYKKALETAARSAKINIDESNEPRRIFPYLLRHSFATLAATSNPPVPLPVAQKVMRHTSSKMLLDVYARAGTMIMREGLSNFNL